MLTAAERLLARTDKNGPVPQHAPELGPCWLWLGRPNGRNGYGEIRIDGKRQGVHRVALSIAIGRPLRPGMCGLHRCDNRVCIRPEHLFEGTKADNAGDRDAKGRHANGDRSGSRRHPERLRRGDAHPARIDPSYLKRGEEYWSAKLTEAKVREIRRLRREHVSTTRLSKLFGVVETTIERVLSGRTWRHVKDDLADARIDVGGGKVTVRS